MSFSCDATYLFSLQFLAAAITLVVTPLHVDYHDEPVGLLLEVTMDLRLYYLYIVLLFFSKILCT